MADRPLLFTPAALPGVKLKNRIALSATCTNPAIDRLADNWHLLHLGKFAQSAAGLTFTETAALAKYGRTTHSDLATVYRPIGVPTEWTYPS